MTFLATYGTQPTAMSQSLQLYVQHANNSSFFKYFFKVTFFGMQLEAVMAYEQKQCCSDVDLCDSKAIV